MSALAAGASPLSVRPERLVNFFIPVGNTFIDVVRKFTMLKNGTTTKVDGYPVRQIQPNYYPFARFPVEPANLKFILPDGRILMTGPATYTEQAAAAANPDDDQLGYINFQLGVGAFNIVADGMFDYF